MANFRGGAFAGYCPTCLPGECPVGTTASRTSSGRIRCHPCAGETVDDDANPQTPCRVCNAGTESSLREFGPVGCAACPPGKVRTTPLTNGRRWYFLDSWRQDEKNSSRRKMTKEWARKGPAV